MIQLINDDNIRVMDILYKSNQRFNLIYADCIYDSRKFDWIYKAVDLLKFGGIFILQTDYHTVADYKLILDESLKFVNWCIYKQEWGGIPKRGFPQKHDDILIYYHPGDYYNMVDFKWYPERIQIPKITANTALDKKGTGLKTPCSVFDDLGNFSTISKERIKDSTGHNIQWQKPMKLMDRLLLPFTDEEDWILELFGGTFPACRWAIENNRNAVGIELNKEVYDIGKKLVIQISSIN